MLKMLVVDDEVDVCDFVRSFFKERDFEVFTAHNGKEALDAVNENKPEIVLLDVRMPVMDGMEALKEIRKIDDTIKVLMVTAADDTEAAEDAKHHGAVEYITKPLLLEQLERSVLTVAEQLRVGQ